MAVPRPEGTVVMTLAPGVYGVPAGKLVECTTHLEMTERPALRAEPVAAPFGLKQARRPDLHWYRELFVRIGADWLWTSRLILPDDELRAIIGDPAVRVYALRSDGRDEGLLELDFRIPQQCEIAFFGLAPGLIGRGAGRWLMNRAIELAWSQPIRRLWVHTCSLDHRDALGFYRRSGFRPFRRTVEVADDPRLNGILPQDAAPHVPIVRV